MQASKTSGCLACVGLQSQADQQEDIYLIPLPQGEPVALRRLVPREKNALRYGVPGFCWDLKFSSDGSKLLFLADEDGESQVEALRQGYITTKGMDLFVADLVHPRIQRVDPFTNSPKAYDGYYDWSKGDQYIVVVREGELLLIEALEFEKNRWRHWKLSSQAGRFWFSPDRERIYFESRGFKRLEWVECCPRAKPHPLPLLPPGSQIMKVLPHKEGVLVISHPYIGPIGGYNPPVAKEVWFWRHGDKAFHHAGTLPRGLEIGALLSYSRSPKELLVWKPFTMYDPKRGEWANKTPQDTSIHIGKWSEKDGSIKWNNVFYQSSTPATGVFVVYSFEQTAPLLLIGDHKANWIQVGLLDVLSLDVKWIRSLAWGRLWAWTPHCIFSNLRGYARLEPNYREIVDIHL